MSIRDMSTSAAVTDGRRVVHRAQRRPRGSMVGTPSAVLTMSRHNPVEETVVVERPWGSFEQFVRNEQVTVKIITVAPGHRLSLQKHDQRGEMWQVLDVPIDITVDERSWTALPGEKIWVPRGSTHRMGNSGDQPGRMLEVAFGHFDEDDIRRLEDDYAR